MQKQSYDKKKDENKIQQHRYNCSCSDCRNKYGGLPLLAEAIDQQSRNQGRQTGFRDEPQASTSSGNIYVKSILNLIKYMKGICAIYKQNLTTGCNSL